MSQNLLHGILCRNCYQCRIFQFRFDEFIRCNFHLYLILSGSHCQKSVKSASFLNCVNKIEASLLISFFYKGFNATTYDLKEVKDPVMCFKIVPGQPLKHCCVLILKPFNLLTPPC